MKTENKQDPSQKEVDPSPTQKQQEIDFLVWMTKNTKSIESVKYPDGSEGELNGNFMIIL